MPAAIALMRAYRQLPANHLPELIQDLEISNSGFLGKGTSLNSGADASFTQCIPHGLQRSHSTVFNGVLSLKVNDIGTLFGLFPGVFANIYQRFNYPVECIYFVVVYYKSATCNFFGQQININRFFGKFFAHSAGFFTNLLQITAIRKFFTGWRQKPGGMPLNNKSCKNCATRGISRASCCSKCRWRSYRASISGISTAAHARAPYLSNGFHKIHFSRSILLRRAWPQK